MKTATLSPAARNRAVETLASTEFDVLVIGGGVTGAGAALDAASRGFSVALIEAGDYACGTSSRASKLIHGGLRYLQMFDFKLVREALTERGRLLTEIAPHLVQPVPFLYPFTHRMWERAYVGAGLMLYDGLSFSPGIHRGVPLHKHLSRRGLRQRFPALRDDAAVGGLRYYDAKVDDSRYVATLIRTAASHGAVAANRIRATGYLTDDGQVTGVTAQDLEDGTTLRIHARRTISATGVWTEETEDLPGLGEAPATSSTTRLNIHPSKGVHIVVPADRIAADAGMILPTERSVLFIIPWDGYWVIGTTDSDWEQDKTDPAANATDIDYLLDHANAVLKQPLTRDDVIGTYAGLRPLLEEVEPDADASAKISREHTAATAAAGLTTIAGGKFTTYRVMAEDAVDHALGAASSTYPSITAHLPLLGADGWDVRTRQRDRIAARFGWDGERVDHLLHRYGSMIDELLELIGADPSLAEPLPGTDRYLKVEVTYAVTHEGALHLDDVLSRRTRLSYEQPDRGLDSSETVADLMGHELGWTASRRSEEIATYRDRVRAEQEAERRLTDGVAPAVTSSLTG